MAQGQALSLFTRLYTEIEAPRLMDAAEATFASFERFLNDGAKPWTVLVDNEGYLWLEEYPTPDADHHAFNGHNFAVYGLYDYYLLTGDALEELKGAVTTVLRYFDDYRNPDGPSYYELRFGVTDEKYHAIHIKQLATLASITGDDRFAKMSEILICDLPPDLEMLEGLSC